MNIGLRMRVPSGLVAVAFVMCGLLPRDSDAAPFLLDATGVRTDGDVCGELTPSATPCALFTIDPFTATALGGSFEHDNDIALFQFVLTEQAVFAAQTTSYVDGVVGGFDPFFGLFYGPGNGDLTGRILTFVDPSDPTGTALVPARSADVIGEDPNVFNLNDALPNPFLQPNVLLGPGTYVLALGQAWNDFQTTDFDIGGTSFVLESLLLGFQNDSIDPDFNGGCATPERCAFSLSISATPVVAPVPEPGTMSLLVLGVAAAVLRRRRRTNHRL